LGRGRPPEVTGLGGGGGHGFRMVGGRCALDQPGDADWLGVCSGDTEEAALPRCAGVVGAFATTDGRVRHLRPGPYLRKPGCPRPGPEQAHFSSQHVEELWQTIDAGVAEKPSHAGQVRVPTPWRVLPVVHRAEFQHSGVAAPDPEALAAREDRTRAIQLDCEGNDRRQWQGQRDQGAREHEIGNSLHTILGLAWSKTNTNRRSSIATLVVLSVGRWF
jgi:hypothetical protein